MQLVWGGALKSPIFHSGHASGLSRLQCNKPFQSCLCCNLHGASTLAVLDLRISAMNQQEEHALVMSSSGRGQERCYPALREKEGLGEYTGLRQQNSHNDQTRWKHASNDSSFTLTLFCELTGAFEASNACTDSTWLRMRGC